MLKWLRDPLVILCVAECGVGVIVMMILISAALAHHR
jgi:hypothetical protein